MRQRLLRRRRLLQQRLRRHLPDLRAGRAASGPAWPPTRGPIRAECDAERRHLPAATTAPATEPAPAASTPPGPTCLAAGCSSGAVHTASPATARAPASRARPHRAARTSATRRARPAGTTCTADAHCTRFCSATACVATPVNLAGNGDVENGTTAGWATNGGTLTAPADRDWPTPARTAPTAQRTANFNGPAYRYRRARVPTPSARGRCRTRTQTQNVALQVNLGCGEPPAGGMFPTVGQFGISLPSGCLDADQRHREPGEPARLASLEPRHQAL